MNDAGVTRVSTLMKRSEEQLQQLAKVCLFGGRLYFPKMNFLMIVMMMVVCVCVTRVMAEGDRDRDIDG